MLKSFTKIIIALLLSVSILGPSLVHYLDLNGDDIVFVDFSEDDSEKKTEKEKKEKEKILESFVTPNSNLALELNFLLYYYDTSLTSMSEDIVSPPPESHS